MAFDMTDLSPEITPEEIRAGREELGLTQKELGSILGVHHTTVSRWELGAVPCDMPGAVKYALEYLKLREWLLNNEIFQTLDESLEDLQKLRERLREQIAQERATVKRSSAE
jgi:transcriptional regulator with XRE-family HTH domain